MPRPIAKKSSLLSVFNLEKDEEELIKKNLKKIEILTGDVDQNILYFEDFLKLMIIIHRMTTKFFDKRCIEFKMVRRDVFHDKQKYDEICRTYISKYNDLKTSVVKNICRQVDTAPKLFDVTSDLFFNDPNMAFQLDLFLNNIYFSQFRHNCRKSLLYGQNIREHEYERIVREFITKRVDFTAELWKKFEKDQIGEAEIPVELQLNYWRLMDEVEDDLGLEEEDILNEWFKESHFYESDFCTTDRKCWTNLSKAIKESQE